MVNDRTFKKLIIGNGNGVLKILQDKMKINTTNG